MLRSAVVLVLGVLFLSPIAAAPAGSNTPGLELREGVIAGVDATAGLIWLAGGEKVQVDPKTQFAREGRPCGLADLKAGDRVRFLVPKAPAVFVELNPQPEPPSRPGERVGLNPQPEPPSRPADFQALIRQVSEQRREDAALAARMMKGELKPGEAKGIILQNPGAAKGLIIQGGIQPSGTQAGHAVTGGTQIGEAKGIILQNPGAAGAIIIENLPPEAIVQRNRVVKLLPDQARQKLEAARQEAQRESAGASRTADPIGSAQQALARQFPGLKAGPEFDVLGAVLLADLAQAEEAEIRALSERKANLDREQASARDQLARLRAAGSDRQAAEELRRKLDSMNEMSESASLRLQMMMDRRSKFVSTLSNIMKKVSQTQDSLVQNLK